MTNDYLENEYIGQEVTESNRINNNGNQSSNTSSNPVISNNSTKTPTPLDTHHSSTSISVANITTVRLAPCCQLTAKKTMAAYKKSSKLDAHLGPSPFRQLLPIALCILSFATVLSILIVYMDTTEIRHQQFRLNMSRDYELFGVTQDDPTLIAFLREIHMKKYPMNFLKNAPIEHLNFTQRHELTPEMANFIADLLGNKMNGNFIQSMTGSTRSHLTGPWLAETLHWSGVIVEPEPRRYFTLRKQNIHRPKIEVIHACVSPNQHPKEVTIHNEEDSEVRINSLLDEETSWFNSRVKCFPLYTLMLAVNCVKYDLLSLGVQGQELEILETLPFDQVEIDVITIHLPEHLEIIEIIQSEAIPVHRKNVTDYIQSITKFLMGKAYKFQRKIENNYIYQKIQSNKSRRKQQSFKNLDLNITKLSIV